MNEIFKEIFCEYSLIRKRDVCILLHPPRTIISMEYILKLTSRYYFYLLISCIISSNTPTKQGSFSSEVAVQVLYFYHLTLEWKYDPLLSWQDQCNLKDPWHGEGRHGIWVSAKVVLDEKGWCPHLSLEDAVILSRRSRTTDAFQKESSPQHLVKSYFRLLAFRTTRADISVSWVTTRMPTDVHI